MKNLTPNARATAVRHAMAARDASRQLLLTPADVTLGAHAALHNLGLDLPLAFVADQMEQLLRGAEFDSRTTFAADDTQGLITTASLSNPIQFLQTWLPGFVRTLTQARKIDELIGIRTVGSWHDEEIIQGILEPTGAAVPYGDYTNVPLSDWNVNFERRTVVRFEQGFRVGILEDARSAAVRINTAAEKRNASQLSLDITRNLIGFYGYNNGASRVYGFLNDPSLPAYVSAAATGSGSTTTWSTKAYQAIVNDIRTMIARLRTGSGDNIDPDRDAITLAVPTGQIDFLTTVSDFGNSVMDWLKKTYPKIRVVSAPELTGANGGANVAYMYADRVADGGSDGGSVWSQLVPSKFYAIGTEKQVKAYVEDFSNALAGVILARPFAVTRLTGI